MMSDTTPCTLCGVEGYHGVLDCVATLRAQLAAAEARVKQFEDSMVRHFQDEHLEGDGPEIDRWKARATALAAQKSCPCEFVESCHPMCSCATPQLSGGCERCCAYGSDAQQRQAARRLADVHDRAAALAAQVAALREGLATVSVKFREDGWWVHVKGEGCDGAVNLGWKGPIVTKALNGWAKKRDALLSTTLVCLEAERTALTTAAFDVLDRLESGDFPTTGERVALREALGADSERLGAERAALEAVPHLEEIEEFGKGTRHLYRVDFHSDEGGKSECRKLGGQCALAAARATTP